MAITFVQSNAAGGEQTVTLDGVVAGNLIIVGYSEVKDASPTTLSCSDGTSSFQGATESSGTYARWRFFYLLSANSGNKTYTISGANGSVGSVIVMEFSYTGTISFEDLSNNYTDESTSVSSNNIQPSGYSLVLGGAYSYGGGDYSSCQINGVARDGLKSYSDLAGWPPMWYRIVTSGFDGAATCTTASAGYYAASAISFREQIITVTTVVDPDMGSGYDYNSLSDWEADLGGTTSGNLPSGNEIAVAKCRCTSGTADTSATTVDGWTTDSTRYIKIWTDTAEAYRHAGLWETGNHYRMETGAYTCIIIQESYVKIEGLQLTCTGSDKHCINIGSAGVASFSWISFCILKGDGADTHGIFNEYAEAGSYLYAWNNIINAQYRGINNWTNTTAYIYNCTIVNCSNGGMRNLGTAYCKNVLSKNVGAGAGDFSSAGTMVNTNCASADDTADDYGGSGNHISHTFSFVGAADFHLQSSDTGAIGLGLNLYNDATLPFQDDIDGQDRGGAAATVWDIGADEYTAGTVTKVVDPDTGSGYDYDSLLDWEAGEQKNLPNNGEVSIAKCRCTSGTIDTGATQIDGWTTDATHYIKVWTDTAESYRHNGTYQDGNKYRLTGEANWGDLCILRSSEAYTKIIGLQILADGSAGDGCETLIGIGLSATGINEVSHCIIKGVNIGSITSGFLAYGINFGEYELVGGSIRIWNNIIYDFYSATRTGHGIYGQFADTDYTLFIYSNTIHNCYYGICPEGDSSTAPLLINNLVQDCPTACYYLNTGSGAAWHEDCSNNCSDDNTQPGSDGRNGEVAFVAEGSDNFHLDPSDTIAKGYGLNLYNDATIPFQTDIDGADRGGSGVANWDIGADELTLIMTQYAFRFRNDDGDEDAATWKEAQNKPIWVA